MEEFKHAIKEVEIDGQKVKIIIFPKGLKIYKGTTVEITEKSTAKFFRGKKIQPSWFSSYDVAYENTGMADDKGYIYEYTFLRDANFLLLSDPDTIISILKIIKARKNSLTSRQAKQLDKISHLLQCMTGVLMSEHDQYLSCAKNQELIDTYNISPTYTRSVKKPLSKDQTADIKRWSIYDIDKEVTVSLCKIFQMDGYFATAVRSDYGEDDGSEEEDEEAALFPTEIATCHQPSVLSAPKLVKEL